MLRKSFPYTYRYCRNRLPSLGKTLLSSKMFPSELSIALFESSSLQSQYHPTTFHILFQFFSALKFSILSLTEQESFRLQHPQCVSTSYHIGLSLLFRTATIHHFRFLSCSHITGVFPASYQKLFRICPFFSPCYIFLFCWVPYIPNFFIKYFVLCVFSFHLHVSL